MVEWNLLKTIYITQDRAGLKQERDPITNTMNHLKELILLQEVERKFSQDLQHQVEWNLQDQVGLLHRKYNKGHIHQVLKEQHRVGEETKILKKSR
jgi:hypothetical protein